MNQKKSFYIFNGSWFDIFDKLVGILQPRNTNQFSIWESKRKTNGHLLITYGTALPHDLQSRHNLKEITEPEFQASYIPSLTEHIVHGYNEFHPRYFRLKLPWFSEN
jgi:hypothetical protein